MNNLNIDKIIVDVYGFLQYDNREILFVVNTYNEFDEIKESILSSELFKNKKHPVFLSYLLSDSESINWETLTHIYKEMGYTIFLPHVLKERLNAINKDNYTVYSLYLEKIKLYALDYNKYKFEDEIRILCANKFLQIIGLTKIYVLDNLKLNSFIFKNKFTQKLFVIDSEFVYDTLGSCYETN